MKFKPPAPPEPPSPPLTPGPPLPILILGINVLEVPAKTQRSLYQDTMGDDLSLVYMALEAPWSSPDMRELAEKITVGQRSINNLSTPERAMLDSMVMAYSGDDDGREKVRQAERDRLSLLDADRAQDEDGPGDGDGEDQVVRDGGGSDVRVPEGDGSPGDAYSWLKEDGG